MKTDFAGHLSRHQRIQQGSYYTPERLVQRVYDLIGPYLEQKGREAIIFDSAGGCGAFLAGHKSHPYRIADYDAQACEILNKEFDPASVFLSNSLVKPDRKKYSIPDRSFLIMIGNPPYNDTTSEFKKGQKGINVCDADLFDRDLGISFLRSYWKLRADAVCVLHPLAYLIKEANFKRLKEFRNNYKLIKGEIFSSELFRGTGSTRFPILVALYERRAGGMAFDHIRSFQFDVLDRDRKFVLGHYRTTDGHIPKYPPGKNAARESPIGLYYWTFRDFNSLKRNASFITKRVPNAVVVKVENIYQYAYLYALKKLFDPDDAWLYGNLSPLLLGDIEKDKAEYVAYALQSHDVLKECDRSIKEQIWGFYGISPDEIENPDSLEAKIVSRFRTEFRRMTMMGSGSSPRTPAPKGKGGQLSIRFKED